MIQTGSRFHLTPIQWVLGALSPEVNWQGHETEYSSPITPKVKKTWIYTSTPLYAFMMQSLIS
jgi:hypothetical protein